MKGAIREIRKDNAFIAREKLKEQIEKYVEINFLLYNLLLIHHSILQGHTAQTQS
jgi:hypothetical protein